jgi:hypothetical protein
MKPSKAPDRAVPASQAWRPVAMNKGIFNPARCPRNFFKNIWNAKRLVQEDAPETIVAATLRQGFALAKA